MLKKYKTIQIPKQKVYEIVCDKCGVKSNDSKISVGTDPYIQTIYIDWEYGSEYDNQLWEIDLCQHCIKGMFKDINIEGKTENQKKER